jgi:SpoVK/Ycf46/Vps4 family AAA+-type ATPase
MSLQEDSVLFLLDFHTYIKGPDVYRVIKNNIPLWAASGRHVVVISPLLAIPAELAKLVTVIDFELPDVEELKAIAGKLVDAERKKGHEISYNPVDVEYAKGLTSIEFENAVSRSIVSNKSVDRQILEDEKLQTIKKQGLMEIYPPEPIEALRGMEQLKKYVEQRKQGFINPDLPNPRGILLVGPPGTGKSLSAKVIAGVMGFPLVKTSPENFKGGIVGESEQKTKSFFKTIKAVAPCVVWFDEIEKFISGAQSSGRSDGGAMSSTFSIILTEMQEMKEPVYFVATCNDINELLSVSQGAFVRRFDDVFFLDLPTSTEREDILKYMEGKYKTEISGILPPFDGWSGAEIEKFVIASLYEGAESAAENIHPVYEQNKENIDRAREWARNNARPANTVEEIRELTGRRLF